MISTKIDPKFIGKANPRVGLIALASDFMIEKDFINVIKNRKIDFFVNRIECYNPLTKENLIKMSNKITEVKRHSARSRFGLCSLWMYFGDYCSWS